MNGESSVLATLQEKSLPVREGYQSVRRHTEALAAPLSPEDQMVQSMPDASPTKWHLAHTTWFFETFLLKPFAPGYRPLDDSYEVLFNSYYQSVGPQFPRPQRGMISRPTLAQVRAYRAYVDEAMDRLLLGCDSEKVERLVILGLNHEQQHQELIVTDIKHAFYQNPQRPAYLDRGTSQLESSPWECGERQRPASDRVLSRDAKSLRVPGGVHQIGGVGQGFRFDNEGPHHSVLLSDYSISRELLTCGAVLDFIHAGGYQDPLVWLSAGWDFVRREDMTAPLYFERDSSGEFYQFTLGGMVPVDPRAPALHLSYFEADAIARHQGVRLPTEAEWEVAAAVAETEPSAHLQDLFDTAWQWTSSAYLPYPGFCAPTGAVGEYNGKFMYNQMVLRGGSLATPAGHTRRTYRNFFDGSARWQFAGVRLAWGGHHE